MPVYRLVIINDVERPEPRMVALSRTHEGVCKWTYVSAWKGHSRYRGWNVARFASDHTELEVFGVRPVIEMRAGAHWLRVERIGESRATYHDGKPRQWQGPIEAATLLRPKLVPALLTFVALGVPA